MPTLKQLKKKAIEHLLQSPHLCENVFYSFQDASLDVDLLLSYLLKINRSSLIANLEKDASSIERSFLNLLEARYNGRSIAYIIEDKEFFSYSFYVNDSVLIPKADSELLVEKGIEAIEELFSQHKNDGEYEINVMDAFSGSGCIGLAVLLSIAPYISVHFTFLDISAEALKVSKINACKLLTKEMQEKCSFSLCDATIDLSLYNEKKYDLILANPPYVPSQMAFSLLSDGRGEPLLALDGGCDGYGIFESFARCAKVALIQNGILLSEVGDGQDANVVNIFRNAGFSNCKAFKDLNSTYRVVKAENC